jgi:hypothetical protein
MIDSAQNRGNGQNLTRGTSFDIGMVNVTPPPENEPWWAFIQSTRFWAAVIGILSIYLESKGWIGEPEKLALASLAAVFVTVKTVDRISDKVSGK